jgi:hypothetical protein
MKKLILSSALLASFALVACNSNQAAEDAANAEAAANVVEAPPPMIVKSTPYRCKDGSIARVDYFNDNVSANVKLGDQELGTPLKAAEPGPDTTYTADGWELVKTDATIELTSPEKPKQSCKS